MQLWQETARETRRGEGGDEVAAKFGSSLGITQRQLGASASSVMPVATSGRIVSVRASSAAHAGLRGISSSTLDFDKVRFEEAAGGLAWC